MKRPDLLFALTVVCLLLSLTFTTAGSSARQLTSAKGAAVAALEQDILKEINLARTRPAEYVAHLEHLRPYFKGKEYTRPGASALMTQEGTQALDDAISFLRAASPAPAAPRAGS